MFVGGRRLRAVEAVWSCWIERDALTIDYHRRCRRRVSIRRAIGGHLSPREICARTLIHETIWTRVVSRRSWWVHGRIAVGKVLRVTTI